MSANPSPWIYRPWLDLLIGCGAWSAPLLAIAMWMTPNHTHGWAISFYALALVFNYPHFMATIYRAYHTRADFEKYKFFTLHLTLLLVLTGVAVHASPALLPWLFTLYICWSPWHYTGQNYGLMMMFTRRSGGAATPLERRWLRAAFIASFVMLLASFETGGSSDPLILSLGIPAKITLPARLVLGLAFAVFSFLGYRRLVREHGFRAMIAPLTLVLTQFLWFVLPTILELHASYQVPQTRYSSGILAVMHSAQYLWITSYYQQREARASGQSRWRLAGYFITLVAGGIALFIPGPWLVSKLLHFDFTTSFLIFTAIVNIHHFMLDGALWKLRDKRISSFLVDRAAKPAAAAQKNEGMAAAPAPRGLAVRLFASPVFRVSVVALLLLWGAFDQVHFALGTSEGNLPALLRAARMDSNDAALEARIAAEEEKTGHREAAAAALQNAIALNPRNKSLGHAYARVLIESGRFQDAYEVYEKMLRMYPRDADALINYGLLAARLNHPDEAVDSWERAVDADPSQPNAQLYLAEALDQRHEAAAAARHWEAFLHLAASKQASGNDPAVSMNQRITASIQLGDDMAGLSHGDVALPAYQSAILLALQSGETRLESVALAHMADWQERSGDAKSAAASYQRGLALDAQSNDSHGAALDWFNYGQFLRRRGLPAEISYACFLRAEDLLKQAGNAQELATVQNIRKQVEANLGAKAARARMDLAALLARAAALPPASF